MPPLNLSDAELEILMTAAQPLEPDERGDFLAKVALEIGRLPRAEIGPGSISRIVREVVHQRWTAPTLESHLRHPAKWSRGTR